MHLTPTHPVFAWTLIIQASLLVWCFESIKVLVGYMVTVWLLVFLAGEQQCPRGCSIHRLGPPAGERDHQWQGAQSEEGLSLPSAHPSWYAAWRQRAGGKHLQSRWDTHCSSHRACVFHPSRVSVWFGEWGEGVKFHCAGLTWHTDSCLNLQCFSHFLSWD